MAKSVRKSDKEIFAFIAAFLSIIGFVIALIAKRNDKYVMYYAKHSLVIFIVGAVAGALQTILRLLPIIGDIISTALTIIVLILWILSWVYALSGKLKEIPVITDWANKINL
jgi:uncharacterized membrane protein